MGTSCEFGRHDEPIAASTRRWDGSRLSLNSMHVGLSAVHGDPVAVWGRLEGFTSVAYPVHEALHVRDAVCNVGDVESLDGRLKEGAG